MKPLIRSLTALRVQLLGQPSAPTGVCPRCESPDIEWVPGEGWLCHNLHDVEKVATRPRVHAELYPQREYSTS